MLTFTFRNLDGSVRGINVDTSLFNGRPGNYPFSATHPKVGQYFFFDSGIYQRRAIAERVPNVCVLAYCFFEPKTQGRTLPFYYEATNCYYPIDIFTGLPC